MPISFNPQSRLRVWLPSDEAIADSDRPVFIMRRPTVEAVLKISELFDDKNLPALDAIKAMVAILEDHLVEIQNLPSKTIAASLVPEEIPLLMKAFIDSAGPGGDDLKKSDWPLMPRPENPNSGRAGNAPGQEDVPTPRPSLSRSKSNVRHAAAAAATHVMAAKSS